MTAQIIDEMDSLIIKIQLSENEAINDGILEDDSKFKDSLMNINDKPVANFNNKKDLELTKTLKEALFIISSNLIINKKIAFYIGLSLSLSINKNDENNE